MPSAPDADQLEFERARRRRQRRLAFVIAALVLGPLGWLVFSEMQVASTRREARLTAAQKAELSALLDRREAIAQERVAHWNEAVQRTALARLALGAAECPLRLEPPSQLSAAAYVKYATHDDAFGTWSLCILREATDAPSCGRTYAVPPELASLRTRLQGDDIYSWDLEKVKSAPPDEELAGIVVVIRSEVRPVVHSPSVGRVSFVPGTLAGRSFLYAPEHGRIICGGDVAVRNSKNVDIEYSHFGEAASAQMSQAEYETGKALERDLEVHLRFAAPRAMVRLAVP